MLECGILPFKKLQLQANAEREALKKKHIYKLMYMSNEVQNLVNLCASSNIKTFSSLESTRITENTGIFSWEKDQTGKRTFFSAKFNDLFKCFDFFEDYMHLYEVIVENAPCNLYFDVEFKFDEHHELDGDKLVNNLIDTVDLKLYQIFGEDSIEVIQLDATQPKKFSRHIIIRSDEFCFINNAECGEFVRNEILTDPELAKIVDGCVYSKNRCFRCVWSSKYANGAKYHLKPLDGTNSTHKESTPEFFMKTLITHVHHKAHRIRYTSDKPQENKLTHPCAVRKIEQTNLIPSELHCTGIEQFVIATFAPAGKVKQAFYSPQYDSLTCYIEGCKFCHNIGREHKSNHIYVVCRLTTGYAVQKCFDPDCRNFESESIPIPADILTNTRAMYITVVGNEELIKPKKESFLKISNL